MSLQQFDVLMIGCGNMAAGFDLSHDQKAPALTHASGYAKHGGFKLSACIDPDATRRSVVAKKWGIPFHCEDFAQLCDFKTSYDVVSICSPTNLHFEHIKAAAALQPKVIFCEKPLTASLQESEEIVGLCAANNIELAVNYSRYWDPSIHELIAQIEQNHWGVLRSVVAHYNKGILNNGSHMVGLLLQLLGNLQVDMAKSIHFDLSQQDPTVAAFLRSDNGVPVYLNPTHASDYAFFELELFFSQGVVRMLNGGLSWQTQIPVEHELFHGYKALSTPKHLAGKYFSAMSLAIANIYEFLTNHRTLISTGSNALAIQKMCESIRMTANKATKP